MIESHTYNKLMKKVVYLSARKETKPAQGGEKAQTAKNK